MSVLVLAVTIVGALCALDLVLTLAVVRRLREHTTALRGLRSADGAVPADHMLPAGTSIGSFTTTTDDGEPLSADVLTGHTLVGFFSPGCEACSARLPDFVDHARTIPGGREQVLAVVVGGGHDPTPYTDTLRRVARLVAEEPGGPVATAFSVEGFPSFYLVGADGAIVVSGYGLDAFPAASLA